MRCYELEAQISQEEDKLIQLRLKDSQHQARNEAMNAFETSRPRPTKEYDKKKENLKEYGYIILARESIDACMVCDFSKPSMAALLKANDNDIIKVLAAPESQEKTYDYRTNAKQE